jgi:adenosylcobinamide-GDP ribazoletransferase
LLAGIFADVTGALAVLTRLPLPDAWTARPLGARSLWAFPLVGVLVGAVAGGGYVAMRVALPEQMAAVVALVLAMLITGALHEDGLADCCDALGGSSRERRLEILRDSRIGAFGTLGLLASVLFRWSALVDIGDTSDVVLSLIVAHAGSRAAIAVPLAMLPPARDNGQAAGLGRPSALILGLTLTVAAGLLFAAWGSLGLAALLITGAVAGIASSIARRLLGGHTGDVLGAIQQVCECALLAAAVVYVL